MSGVVLLSSVGLLLEYRYPHASIMSAGRREPIIASSTVSVYVVNSIPGLTMAISTSVLASAPPIDFNLNSTDAMSNANTIDTI